MNMTIPHEFPAFPLALKVSAGEALPNGDVAQTGAIIINSGLSLQMYAAIHAPADEIDKIVENKWAALSLEQREAWDYHDELIKARLGWANRMVLAIDAQVSARNAANQQSMN